MGIGDWASVIGVILSLGGFAATLVNVRKTRRAAIAARDAANRVRSELRRTDVIAEFSAAIATIAEIKRLQRLGNWEGLLDRYTVVRHALITVRSANPDLTEDQRASITGALTHLRETEKAIEMHLTDKRKSPDVARTNEMLSQQADHLAEILAVMRIHGKEVEGE